GFPRTVVLMSPLASSGVGRWSSLGRGLRNITAPTRCFCLRCFAGCINNRRSEVGSSLQVVFCDFVAAIVGRQNISQICVGFVEACNQTKSRNTCLREVRVIRIPHQRSHCP